MIQGHRPRRKPTLEQCGLFFWCVVMSGDVESAHSVPYCCRSELGILIPFSYRRASVYRRTRGLAAPKAISHSETVARPVGWVLMPGISDKIDPGSSEGVHEALFLTVSTGGRDPSGAPSTDPRPAVFPDAPPVGVCGKAAGLLSAQPVAVAGIDTVPFVRIRRAFPIDLSGLFRSMR